MRNMLKLNIKPRKIISNDLTNNSHSFLNPGSEIPKSEAADKPLRPLTPLELLRRDLGLSSQMQYQLLFSRRLAYLLEPELKQLTPARASIQGTSMSTVTLAPTKSTSTPRPLDKPQTVDTVWGCAGPSKYDTMTLVTRTLRGMCPALPTITSFKGHALRWPLRSSAPRTRPKVAAGCE